MPLDGEPRSDVTDYKDLEVWQRAIALCEEIYRLTEAFPERERYGLSVQMRRAAVSIPSNIAEGYGRGSRQDYTRFVKMSRGSAAELETQLILADKLQLGTPESTREAMRQLEVVRRLAHGLVKALDRSQ